MPQQKVDIVSFLRLAQTCPVFDVRSPSEFSYAHIPGANNLPIFDDSERADIGTLYKQVGREEAIEVGLKYFGPKLNDYIKQVNAVLKKYPQDCQKVLIHCWRGGMRSSAMAWLLSFCGKEVVLLEGGYKNYRNWVIKQFDQPFKFNVLGGFTGSGKTEVLHEINKMGFAMIDLEGIASHKGSAFGALGQPMQPSQEQFENNLVQVLMKYTSLADSGVFVQNNPIWIESESQRIGLVNLTNAFYDRVIKGDLYVIHIPFEERLNFIIEQYGKFEREKLINAIMRIQKRLGGLDTKLAIQFIVEGDIASCFRVLLQYYDKEYLHARKRIPRVSHEFQCEKVDALANAKILLQQLT
jgi:tRNA 2-selenouridine synthase